MCVAVQIVVFTFSRRVPPSGDFWFCEDPPTCSPQGPPSLPPCQPCARPHSALRSSPGQPGSGSVFRSAGRPAPAPPSFTMDSGAGPPVCGALLSGRRLPALRAWLPLGAGAGPLLCPVSWSARSSVTRPFARRLQTLSCLPPVPPALRCSCCV